MIPLVSPTITGADRQHLRQRIADGLLEDETEVRRFEEAFAERVGCTDAIAVCSGSVALQLAIRSLEVAFPSWTCVAVRNAASRGTVKYFDSSWNVRAARMDVDTTPPCSTVVVPHGFGQATGQVWREHAPRSVIEDYTLSLGGVQSLTGQVGVCSTHASKMISTGRGGVIFSNDQALLDELRQLAHYETHLGVAYSYGMSATQAALGVSQLAQLDDFIERRRTIAWRYTDAFEPVGIDCPDPDCGSVFFRYLIAVADPADKIERLRQHGIECGRGVWPPLHQLADLPDERFPGTMESVNRLLSVPCWPGLEDAQVAYIAEQVVRVCAP